MGIVSKLEGLLSVDSSDGIAWDRVEELLEPSGFTRMRGLPQNPVFHGERDVMTHTRMVCEWLLASDGFRAASHDRRAALLLAALLHDVGKTRTTREVDGRWTSPHHAAVGSRMAREFLWRSCGMGGSDEALRLREEACALVRSHMLPTRLLERPEPERLAREVASVGELVPGFTWRELCLLSEADLRGRIAGDVDERVEGIELCRLFVEEAGCLEGQFGFADAHTRRAYLSGKNVSPEYALFDGTWGEVTLVCGLAGTGKDTWIERHLPDVAMVSLDDVRREVGVGPQDEQGRVIQEATERARVCLRDRKPFVWNATNLTVRTRRRIVELCEAYGARTRIVYLEAPWDVTLERNDVRSGDARVPVGVIERMLARLEPPLPGEADAVEWRCV